MLEAMTPTTDPTSSALLTARQVGDRLLEEATLAGWRSQGRDGLIAVKVDRGAMFRAQDVEDFIRNQQHAA